MQHYIIMKNVLKFILSIIKVFNKCQHKYILIDVQKALRLAEFVQIKM